MLTRHGKHFQWDKECRNSFRRLRDLLAADSVLYW